MPKTPFNATNSTICIFTRCSFRAAFVSLPPSYRFLGLFFRIECWQISFLAFLRELRRSVPWESNFIDEIIAMSPCGNFQYFFSVCPYIWLFHGWSVFGYVFACGYLPTCVVFFLGDVYHGQQFARDAIQNGIVRTFSRHGVAVDLIIIARIQKKMR